MFRFKKFIYWGFIIITCLNCGAIGSGNPADKLADWTLFVYMESDKELNDAAIKNITDMARSGVPGNINVVIQLHVWQETAWRYVVSGSSIILDSSVELTLDPEQDLINGLTWAFTKFPSQKIMTVLWNHGFGILDPVWSEHQESWVPENIQDVQVTRSRLVTDMIEHKNHRGVLFYPFNKVFLTNSGMVNAFNKIKNTVLGGRKIDIISADACKMAMIEIAYQLSEFGDYLIGSQDCELKDGCDYFSLINNLSKNLSPKDIAINIVRDYETYYKPRAACGRYTQSAIDLNNINNLIISLDDFIKTAQEIYEAENLEIKKDIFEIINSSRKVMPEFCKMPSYIDITSYFNSLKEELSFANSDKKFDKLISTIDNLVLAVNKSVVANTRGFKSAHAQGLSIYYPYDYSDCSYIECLFAKNSAWLSFLRTFATNQAF